MTMMTCDKCGLECSVVQIEEPTVSEFWGTRKFSYELYLYSECCGADVCEVEEDDLD